MNDFIRYMRNVAQENDEPLSDREIADALADRGYLVRSTGFHRVRNAERLTLDIINIRHFQQELAA